jgi:glycosyltransferase domain-containing protein
MKLDKNFSDITFLMLTNNRPHTLLRNLSFMNSYEYKVKIIVLDSSLKKIDLKLYSNSNLDIKHLHFKPTTSPHKKIFYSLKYIKSRFCLTMAEDDFFFLNSIYKCLKFLRKNNKYVSANGYNFLHSDFSRTKKGLFSIYKLGGKENRSNLAERNIIRIKNFLNGKMSYNYYSVCKTIAFKRAQNKIYDWSKGQGTGEYDELLYSILILNYGKSKFLNIPHSSREPNYGTSSLFNSKSIENHYKKWNSKFVKVVCNLLAKKEKKIFKKYLFFVMSKRLNFLRNRNDLNSKKSIIYFFKWFKLNLKNFFLIKIYPKYYLGLDFFEIKKIKKFIVEYPNVQNEVRKSRLFRKNRNLLF